MRKPADSPLSPVLVSLPRALLGSLLFAMSGSGAACSSVADSGSPSAGSAGVTVAAGMANQSGTSGTSANAGAVSQNGVAGSGVQIVGGAGGTGGTGQAGAPSAGAGAAAGAAGSGGSATGGTSSGGAGGGASSSGVKIGLQGYSVRNYLNSDFRGTLQKLKDFGYDGIEFPGDGFQGDPAEVKKWLDTIGFQVIAQHFWLNDIQSIDGPANWSLQVGAQVVVVRYPAGDTEGVLRAAAPKYKAKGLQLEYHNHDFDVHDLDKWMTDIPELNAEVDCAWANIGGFNAVNFLAKWKGRVGTIHLKDYDSKHGNAMKPLGQGNQDIKGMANAAVAAGVTWIIYEDESGIDGLRSAQQGRAYLKDIGY